MNKHYHYFAIKTLACYAGLPEEEAQTVAFFSQQVDDYTMNLPICVDKEPPDYFKEHGYAKELLPEFWMVLPHPTGLNVALALKEQYQKTTLVPFHFIPGRTFSEIGTNAEVNRAEYRCLPASDENAELVRRMADQAVAMAKAERSSRNLMRLGMVLHSYADTFAHCGFSGLSGWENHATIKKAYNQETGEEEVPSIERAFYETLPAIGHGRVGHVPDVCVYDLDLSSRQKGEDAQSDEDIVRKNNEWFMEISKMIFVRLCQVTGFEDQTEEWWSKLSGELSKALMVSSDDETNTEALIKHWKQYFPEICYEYDRNSRFYAENHSTHEELEQLVHHVTGDFYTYNELAYEQVEMVLGANTVPLSERKMLLQESLSNPVRMTQLPQKSVMSMKATEQDGQPKTELGLAVYTAGFEYCPEEDIIYSTMNNIQRHGGYCWAYDEAAITISSVIDCEPIYFRYGGYDWMIELWKGQYGIETGAEIGLYYHKTGEKEEPLSYMIMGEFFGCVRDEDMLDMTFSLERNGKELFARDWTRHWWLTGFRWGEISKPEELEMKISIRFPNEEMLQAFIDGGMGDTAGKVKKKVYGLKAMGYEYTLAGENEISFAFANPFTKQPELRTKLGEKVLELNGQLVAKYNSVKGELGIQGNDPDVIGTALGEKGGEEEEKLYKALVKLMSNRKGNLSECKGHI